MGSIGIIIQARTNSSRLPEKVLKSIEGRPLLEFLIKRLKAVRLADLIIVATTENKADDRIASLCKKLKVPCFRGSENNVLERYLECARQYDVDTVIRVCSDCPLADPGGIDELIKTFKSNPGADLVHNKHSKGYIFGTGAELITKASLEKAHQSASTESQKEHVIPFILEHPDRFRIISVAAPLDLVRKGYFLTVDYPQDLEVINAILAICPGKDKENISMAQIVEILDKNPQVANLNVHLHQGFQEEKRVLIVRADGNKEIGMGHITRCTDVAHTVKGNYDEVCFVTKSNEQALDYLRAKGVQAISFQGAEEMALEKINEVFKGKTSFDILIDLRDLGQNIVDLYKTSAGRVICFTDNTEKVDIESDLVFAFSPNQREENYREVKKGVKYYIGPEYFPLSPAFAAAKGKNSKIAPEVERILVTLGGSDAENLTLKTIRALLKLNKGLKITVVLGHAFGKENEQTLEKYCEQGIVIKRAIENMAEEMLKSDMGICSAGNTLLEFMCLGVPVLVIPQTKLQAEHAAGYGNAIVRISGYGKNIDDQEIIDSAERIITDADLRKKLSHASVSIIDGKGIERIVEAILA